MLQQEKPDDYVIATGKQYSIREFIAWTAKELGIELQFSGKGENEIAIVAGFYEDNKSVLKVGDVVMRVDPYYYRPAEVSSLLGDPSKARVQLGWVPKKTAQQLCSEMTRSDLKLARQALILKGYETE
jgi:GDPmannose 4,6-dehydratase